MSLDPIHNPYGEPVSRRDTYPDELDFRPDTRLKTRLAVHDDLYQEVSMDLVSIP